MYGIAPQGSLPYAALPATTATYTLSFASVVGPTSAHQKTVQKPVFASTVTAASAHVIQRLVIVVLTSSITAAGVLQKKIFKPFASSIGLSGILTKLVQLQTKTSSVTASGTVQKTVVKQVFASTIALSGAIQRTVLKPLASTIGLTGALTRLASMFRTFTGTVTPVGSVQKSVQKQTFTSTVGLSGVIARMFKWTRASSVGPTGTIQKTVQKPLVSSIGISGALSRVAQLYRTSTVGLSGIRTFLVRKTMTSTISPSGAITKQVQVSRTSTIGLAGTLARRTAKSFASSVGLNATIDVVIKRFIFTRRFLVYALQRIRTVLAHIKVVVAPAQVRTVQPSEDAMAELPAFSPKRVDEVDNFAFDFINQLGVGETLTAPIVIEIIVSSESEIPDAGPSLAVSGAALIGGPKVLQKLQAGLNGCLYVVTARVATSTGRTLECAARLLVKDETA
jgi:hypothetical protein